MESICSGVPPFVLKRDKLKHSWCVTQLHKCFCPNFDFLLWRETFAQLWLQDFKEQSSVLCLSCMDHLLWLISLKKQAFGYQQQAGWGELCILLQRNPFLHFHLSPEASPCQLGRDRAARTRWKCSEGTEECPVEHLYNPVFHGPTRAASHPLPLP